MKPRMLVFLSFCLLMSCKFQAQENSSMSAISSGVHVPEGYIVELAAGPELVDYPMFATLDATGRLFVFESTGNVYEETKDALEKPQFRIKLLEDLNDDGIFDKATIFADSVGFPQGGVFYQGSLYASSAPDLLKLTDTNSDGVADQRQVLLTGWVLNVNANSLIGPFMGPDGWLYMTSAIMGFDVTTLEGERLKGETSRIWRVRPDGSNLEWIAAGGMNNPVELTFTDAGEPIGTETYFTNPKAGQRDALVYWIEGGVYPKPNRNIDRDSLIRTGELMPVVTKYSRVSPAGIGRYRNTAFGEDFKGNLFSAQFNTHRVIRHKLFREGASFRTEDEVFFSADNEDFHPTDVLEDADGSLLIVETGGWFIKGCPLSQVSKPELKGSIFRVRKVGERSEDPYGNKIDWASLSADDLAEYAEDPRPFVGDRSMENLITRSEVYVLDGLVQNSASDDVRSKAVFALYRIGTQPALRSMRRAFDDPAVSVRVAAARAAGLARDTNAVDQLLILLRDDELSVRRQAALALGQIGDQRAVPALLAAADQPGDRFVEHAITYSLIGLKDSQPIVTALQHPSSLVRRVAMVALDQMSPSRLKADQVVSALESGDSALRQTALWTASHHPEWSGPLSRFMQNRLRRGALTDEERQLFTEALVAFCDDRVIQNFIAEELQREEGQHVFFLKVMGACTQKEFPATWSAELKRMLRMETDPEIVAGVLEVIRLRSISSMSGDLRRFAATKSRPALLRLEAMESLISADPELTQDQFQFVYDQLDQSSDASVRLKAASVLSRAKLSERQLATLATDYLPRADGFILSRLVPVFSGARSADVGTALANALMNSSSLDSYTEENLKGVFESFPASINPVVDQLMTKLRSAHAERLEHLRTLESQISNGVLENGRALFFGKAVCSTCHTIGPEGGTLGPDLTSIQRDRSVHDLLEAIVYPGASFVREYETYQVNTSDAEYRGIIQRQSPTEILLATGPETSVLIHKQDIGSMKVLDVSLMPQGLDKVLTSQEMADLMAFILGQDQDPKRDERMLRRAGQRE